jgi:putative hydrolase of the HAD superfamily
MKAVIFDFYGTLAEFTSAAGSWSQMAAEHGYEIPHDKIVEFWEVDGHEHDEHSQSRDHYVRWQQERMRRLLDECGIPPEAREVFLSRVLTSERHRDITAYEDALPVLGELRRRGYTLAVCSNWDWDLRDALAYAGLTDAVDLVVSSAWVGARKPHPRIYAHTLGALGVEAAQVLFVGDTWTCDVEGPLEAGMHPVYVRRPHFAADTTVPSYRDDERPIHRAADLGALLDLLS